MMIFYNCVSCTLMLEEHTVQVPVITLSTKVDFTIHEMIICA